MTTQNNTDDVPLAGTSDTRSSRTDSRREQAASHSKHATIRPSGIEG
ncbi:MAG: hypothetical protein M8354_11245 [Halalkalicoccus sp.]|nr:hypothetical protein [Halalkalicoccus sp.]